MRHDEITQINERRVKSSWIADLSKYGNGVLMTLLNDRSYNINNIPDVVYRQWLKAPSKGKFWHRRIRGNFRTDRQDE